MVCERLMQRMTQTSDQTEEVSCAPLSVVMTDGNPKLEIHEERSACAQTTAVIEDRGTTSSGGPVNHREDICKSLTVGERINQIQMNMRKTSARNRNFLHRGMNMFLNFILLAGKTCFSPGCYFC